jgi:hypothetical protein
MIAHPISDQELHHGHLEVASLHLRGCQSLLQTPRELLVSE